MYHRELRAVTFEELANECWDALPPLRKRLAGKPAVRRMVADALTEWDAPALAACVSNADLEQYEHRLAERIRTRRSASQEYGFALLTILLTAVLVAVIQWLVQRWLDNHFSEADLPRLLQEAVA